MADDLIQNLKYFRLQEVSPTVLDTALCPTCRLPLDFVERMRLARQRPRGCTLWECDACSLAAWPWDWDDADAGPLR